MATEAGAPSFGRRFWSASLALGEPTVKPISVITGLCALTISLTLVFTTPALADRWAMSAASVGDLVIAERVAPARSPGAAPAPRPAAQLTFILAAEGGRTELAAADPLSLARPYCYTCHLDQ